MINKQALREAIRRAKEWPEDQKCEHLWFIDGPRGWFFSHDIIPAEYIDESLESG